MMPLKETKIVINATRFMTHLRQFLYANIFACKIQEKSKIICMEMRAQNGTEHITCKMHKICDQIQLKLHKMKNEDEIFVIKIKKWHADC